MEHRAALFVNDIRIGSITRLTGGRFEFAYDATYRADEANHPLSLSMPMTAAVHRDSRGEAIVTHFLWGLLPDDRNVLQRYAAHFSVPETDPLALLEAIGADCPGALSFASPDRGQGLALLDETHMADVIEGLQRGRTSAIFGRNPGYFSLAGAQPKTALVYRDRQWYMPLGDEPSTHIVKPAMRDLEDQPLNEHFCLQLAREAGLSAPNSWVERFGADQAVVVERFDRLADNGFSTLRIHTEDMCQALGYAPSQKYEQDGGPGIRAIGQLLRDNATHPAAELEQFMRAVMFNVLVCGTDAHAKNYSIWHVAGPELALAPLYDINSLYPYALRRNERKMAMAVRGHRIQHDIRPEHFVVEGEALGLTSAQVLAWLRDMAEQLPDKAEHTRTQMPCQSKVIDQIVDEIKRYAARLLRQVRIAAG